MAKWTSTPVTFTTEADSATSERDVVFYLQPVEGYNIQAKNFKIGGGIETNGNQAAATETNIWEASDFVSSWNADSEIKQVRFWDYGDGSQPNSYVGVTITVASFTPSATTTLYMDIDEREDNPIVETGGEPRNICLETRWDYSANHTVTQTSLISSVTSSDVATGDADNQTKKKLNGDVPDGTTTDIATIKFEAIGPYHYQTGSGPSFYNLKYPVIGVYEDTYSWALVPGSDVYVDGLLQEIAFKISHEPPEGFNEPDDVCPFGHYVNIPITLVPDVVAPVDTINSVGHIPEATHIGGGHPIQVFGTKGAAYSISVQKKTSTTSSVTAASNGHYNFTTRSFQTAEISHNSTIGGYGVTEHQLVLPPITNNVRYDITISGLVDGVQTVLGPRVPTKAGDAKITQYGVNTLTVTPITNTAGNFGTLPANVTIIRPIRFNKDGYNAKNADTITLKGSTGGVSSTRLVLDKHFSSIKIIPGMIVTGNAISHATTVSKVNGNIITLSGASTIAASTDIAFTNNNGNILPFSFTILPNSNTLNVTASADLFASVGGFDPVKNSINGTAAKTVTHTLDSTKGIVPGMTVVGDEVKIDAGTSLTVASVTNSTVIVLSEIQSFVDNARLKFSNGNTSSKLSLHSIQVNKVGSDIVITGYINAASLGATAQARVYIDDMITVS